MDNEAPNYAKWIPEAGGYVSNGKVLSKSPVYDENGIAKIVVDTRAFPTLSNTTKAQPQVANNPITNVGITTANTTGSNIDANSMATKTGSLASLNLNTANTNNSAISSPATQSNVAGKVATTPLEKANQDYQDAAGRNDMQGMINALTQISALTGQDYSAEISRLTEQREQKIMNTDNQYLADYSQANNIYKQSQSAYNIAVMQGDEEGAKQAQEQMNQAQAVMDQINNEQTAWREAVGYETAMQSSYKRDMQNQQIKFETTYMDGINNQIVPALLQFVNSYINFQYDPATDENLKRAQAYTEMMMRNRANAIGALYSTDTDYAVTQALANLIPVYQQMAKDEIKESISMLQSTASFLLNLEEMQFNMWKTQIQLQFDANADKRAQVKNAIEASNARGYVKNEEAALLGVEPGSLSQQAREHEEELQEELEREQRALQQKMILADYNNQLEMENYKEKAKIDAYYDSITYENRLKLTEKYSGGNGGNTTRKDGIEITQVVESKDGKKTTIKRTVYPDGNGGFVDAAGNSVEGIFDENSSMILPNKLKNEDGTWNDTEVKKYIYDEVGALTAAEQADAITDLVYDYVYDKIDKYYNEIGDKSSAKKAVTNAYNDVNRFATWVEDTDLSNDQKLLAIGIATDRLVGRVNQAEYAPEVKTKVLQELVSTMDKSGSTTMKAAADNYSQYRKSTSKASTNTKNTPTPQKNVAGRTYVSSSEVKSFPSATLSGKVGYVNRNGKKVDVMKDEDGDFYYST